ncbi:MAG: hypothetical protein ACYTEQ_14405 [Planctomycetota bacterium]|jgi:hypothetical protein
MITKYVNVVQLAAAINLPETYLMRLAKTGDIPSIQMGKTQGSRRFQESEVRAALSQMASKPQKRSILMRTHEAS